MNKKSRLEEWLEIIKTFHLVVGDPDIDCWPVKRLQYAWSEAKPQICKKGIKKMRKNRQKKGREPPTLYEW